MEHARLTHLALEGDFSAISVLDEDQIALITSKVDTYDWRKQADYSFRDFLIESGKDFAKTKRETSNLRANVFQ